MKYVKIPVKAKNFKISASFLVELYVELMNFNRRLNFGRQQGSHDLWYVKVGTDTVPTGTWDIIVGHSGDTIG